MTDRPDLEEFARTLRARLAELDGLEAASRDARRPVELDQSSVGRLSRMDAMQQQAMALAIERRRQAERQKLNAALQRLERGDYGYCVGCGDAIAPDRLRRDPAIALCADCMRRGKR